MMTGILSCDILSHWPIGLGMLVVATIVTLLLYRRSRWQTVGIGVCFLILGMTLGARHREQLNVRWPDKPVRQAVVVASEPTYKARWVVMDVLTADGHRLKLRLERNADSEGLVIGEGLSIYARIKKVHEWQQGHFSYRRYLQSHGFVGEAFVRSRQWTPHEVSLAGWSAVERLRLQFLVLRHQLLVRYRQWGIDTAAYGILAAMTLGDKSAISPETKELFSMVGASHVLALSGLHLMILYGVITLLTAGRRSQTLSQVVIVTVIWAFALLTGLSASVVRSAAMITLYALLSLGYREKMSVNTLAFVAIVMLVINPYALYDMGFQLSFLAVLAIVLFNPLFRELIPLHILQRHRWLDMLWSLTTVSVAAQVGTAPLVAYYFYRLPVVFLLSNLIVIPLAWLILHLTLCMVALCWWSWATGIAAQLLSGAVQLMNTLLSWLSTLPACSIGGLHLSTLQVFFIYILIVCGYVLLNLRCRAIRQNA